jgi:hypothetical protein
MIRMSLIPFINLTLSMEKSMKFLLVASLFASLSSFAETATTAAPAEATKADQVVTAATTEVKAAAKTVKKALNKAAKKIETKVEADNTPKGEAAAPAAATEPAKK